jgi:hypothetical protein
LCIVEPCKQRINLACICLVVLKTPSKSHRQGFLPPPPN